MDFSQALKYLKDGNKIAREGWNGKGMWVAAQFPDAESKMGLPYIYMKTVDGSLVPWVASHTDLFRHDWNIVSGPNKE